MKLRFYFEYQISSDAFGLRAAAFENDKVHVAVPATFQSYDRDEVVHQELAPLARSMEADLSVMACQVDSLRAALVKVLQTREKEAAAHMAFQVASDNYASGASREGRRHLQSMTAASDAEKEARLLLATLKTPNGQLTGPRERNHDDR